MASETPTTVQRSFRIPKVLDDWLSKRSKPRRNISTELIEVLEKARDSEHPKKNKV